MSILRFSLILTVASFFTGCFHYDLPQNVFFGTSDYPFESDEDSTFMLNINRMWHKYGLVDDGDNAVLQFGNEPTYFDWIAEKIYWAYDEQYKLGLKLRIRDFAMDSNGYIWSWSDSPGWPSDNSRHYGNNVNFINAVYRVICWEHSTDFLSWEDSSTTGAGDVSEGKTVRYKVYAAMDYLINNLYDSSNLLVLPDENNGTASGDPSNYWDNLPFGHKDAYTNIYFYKALLAMSVIAEIDGNTTAAADYTTKAALVKAAYDNDFWDTTTGRFVGCIDSSNTAHDYGFTYVNLEALAAGLGDQTQGESIFDWLDGNRIVAGDNSVGSDIYGIFRYAPRSNTKAIESIKPYWWEGLDGTKDVSYNSSFGQHMENGGTIFYISFYDLMARSRIKGADSALTRFKVIADEFSADGLKRDRRNKYWVPWVEGITEFFPESGLVPTAFLYAFMGIDAEWTSLKISPNLPSSMTTATVHDLTYARNLLDITITDNKATAECDGITIETKDGIGTISLIIEQLLPNHTYTISGTTVSSGSLTASSAGIVTIEIDISGNKVITISP